MTPRFLLPVVGAALLGACATPNQDIPIATNFPTSKQQTLRAAAHWQTIGRDLAGSIGEKINKAAGKTPQSEVIVTFAVFDDQRHLARASNAYYVMDADFAELYRLPKPVALARLPVKGGD